MYFHLILTTQCNLQCKYCYGKSCDDIGTDFGDFEIDYSLPKDLSYPIEWLRDFCKKDPECILTFYGGEPTLCTDKIRQIIDQVPAKRFLIQTNGLFLDKLGAEYVNRLHTILVSVDGNEKLTDHNRGTGVYRRVVENLKKIVNDGFKGEIIARMTVTEDTDIYKQVTWLLENEEFPFSSVHWQLDAGFWKNDFAQRLFEKWVKESYNPGVKRLAEYWVDNMESSGKVLRLYPFLAVMHSLLYDEKSLLRCGSGWINYSILTDGNIMPCPIMGGMKDFYVGHIKTAHPLKLRKIFVSDQCAKCSTLNECGGRCLYANITKLWDDGQYALVCDTVKNLINTLKGEESRVRRLISQGKISSSDFDYLKYNGCEIIP
ncbi:MAG TPA: TIGR04084 family radical SAM/SPASM domain-containing protein [Candidatus Bathyarchaeia archaeon]|nr:TIGR04084 family radical SAM/SPASM domain-containing protein [Candidatus Bathyarchaeia archaeon]